MAGYAVQVYYNQIAGLYKRGGPGGGWIYRVSEQMITAARAAAPGRTGELRRGHRVERVGVTNQYMATYAIYNVADHADYVHQGTYGPIFPDGEFLWVPTSKGATSRTKRAFVEGQKPNPWLDRSCTMVAMRYGAVPIG